MSLNLALLTLKEEHRLKVFEDRVQRKIFRPVEMKRRLYKII
jgi:hypothetical protein